MLILGLAEVVGILGLGLSVRWGSAEHDIDRHMNLAPKHEVKWSITSGRVDARVVCHAQVTQVALPLKWMFLHCLCQHTLQRPIEPFY